jgi:hypothetical protein
LLVSFLLAALSMRAVPPASAGPYAPQVLRRVHLDVLYSASLLHAVGKNDVQEGPVSLVLPVDPEDLERVRTLYTKYRPISGKTAAAQTALPGGVGLGVRP